MFIIENGKIANAKTIDIGKMRVINLQFQSDLDFQDNDTFTLVLGGTLQNNNFAFNNAGYVRFSYVDVDTVITSSSNNLTIKVYQGETQILDDTITITADYASGGVTQQYVNTAIQTAITGLASESYVNTAIWNASNTSPIYVDSVAKTTSLTVNYTADKHIYSYTYNGQGTLQIALSGISSPTTPITFEIWIDAQTAVSTLTLSSSYTTIGIPDTLESSKKHVFVVRAYGNDVIFNYSYSY